MNVQPQPLSAAAFAPFGEVIEAGAQAEQIMINSGHTTRFHALATVGLSGADDRAIISIFRSSPLPRPINIQLLERHPLGSQAFYPLSGRPYLVVVAPPGELDCRNIQVFIASSEQGVNYHAGTWHHYSLALDGVSDFLVVDRTGPGNNCDEIRLSPAQQFSVEY